MKKKTPGRKTIILWKDSEGDAYTFPPKDKRSKQVTPEDLKSYQKTGLQVVFIPVKDT